MNARRLCRRHDLFRVDLAKASDVFADRTVKEFDILRQIADIGAELRPVPVMNLGAIQADAARHRQIDAEYRPCQGGFSRGTRPDKPHQHARVDH